MIRKTNHRMIHLFAFVWLLLLAYTCPVQCQNCTLQIWVYPNMISCQNFQPPTALGELSVDGNCHTTNVLSFNTVDDISLLPGNYRAVCHSNGTMLHFFASGCRNDHCGSNSQLVHATNSTDHCDMNVSSPSSLYARTDTPEYPIQKLEDASASGNFACLYLNSDIVNVNVTFVIFGDCSDPECSPLEPSSSSSSSVVPMGIIPTPSPSYDATTIIMPTSRSTKDPQQHTTSEAPTTASIVMATTLPTINVNHNNNNNPHNNPLSETASSSSSSSSSSTNHIGRIVAISLGMMSLFVAYALLLYYRGQRDGRRQHHHHHHPPPDDPTDIMTTTIATPDYVSQHPPPPSQPNSIVPSSSSSSLYSSSTNLSRTVMTSASAVTQRFSNLRIRGTDTGGGGGGSSSMNSRMMVSKPSPEYTTDVELPNSTMFHDIPSGTMNRTHSNSTQSSDDDMK